MPLPGLHVRLVDADGTDSLVGDAGELWVRGPNVFAGYWNMPEKTAAALRDGGWYHSGDVVRRDERGFHYFVGRDDDMFVCGGENIWPAEVERLLESHPSISQAVVVPIPDELKQKLPVAFVTLREGAPLTEQAVKQWTIERGPAYQHPRHVFFVPAIPLAGTYKIDRNGLTKQAAELAAARRSS